MYQCVKKKFIIITYKYQFSTLSNAPRQKYLNTPLIYVCANIK